MLLSAEFLLQSIQIGQGRQSIEFAKRELRQRISIQVPVDGQGKSAGQSMWGLRGEGKKEQKKEREYGYSLIRAVRGSNAPRGSVVRELSLRSLSIA